MIQSFVVFKGKYKHIEIEFDNQYGELSVIQEAVSISRKNLFSTKRKTQVVLIRKAVDYVERSYIVLLKSKGFYYYGVCLFAGNGCPSYIQVLVDTCLNYDFEKIMSQRPFFKSLHYPNTRTDIQRYMDENRPKLNVSLKTLPKFKGIDNEAIFYVSGYKIKDYDEILSYYNRIVFGSSSSSPIKKIIKVIGIVFLVIIVLFGILIFIDNSDPDPKDNTETVTNTNTEIPVLEIPNTKKQTNAKNISSQQNTTSKISKAKDTNEGELNKAKQKKIRLTSKQITDAETQYKLGLQNYDRNAYQQAVKWWIKAAQQGHSYAQYRLGVCYDLGKGVLENNEKAEYWYTKAAEQGHTQAQINLYYYYKKNKDLNKATYWYNKSHPKN